jgi:hypothetical protein
MLWWILLPKGFPPTNNSVRCHWPVYLIK